MSTAVALVKAGLGVAILPSSAVEVSSPGITVRPVEDRAFVRRIGVIRRKEGAMREIAQQFIDSIIARSRSAAPASAAARRRGLKSVP